MQIQDRIIKQFPEVETVLGKAGRAETSTDPAPLSMMETVIVLKPHEQWRKVNTWYSDLAPEWSQPVLRRITPDHISTEQLVDEMNEALKLPGVSNAWTMPIKARIDMLTTGVRTPVGIKIYGANIEEIERLGTRDRSNCCRKVAGTRSVFAERTGGGYFLDFDWNRDRAGALRADHRRRAGGRDERDRRRERDDHRRGPRAVSGERALHARLPQRSGPAGRVLVPVNCLNGRRRCAVSCRFRNWRPSRYAPARRCCATKTGC